MTPIKRSTTRSLLIPGAKLNQFRIIRGLGIGGMGQVYMAKDEKLGRKVAIKIVRIDSPNMTHAMNTFLSEAKILARFSHPNIAAIYEVGKYLGYPFIVMEYLDGTTLELLLEKRKPGPKEAMRIGHSIATALAETHSRGVLHRDLKPANILLPIDGRLRVVDFGLARGIITDAAEQVESEDVVGTPSYMAPEQWSGQDWTAETDIWALGVIMYEMVKGEPPYRGDFKEIMLSATAPRPVPKLEEAGYSRSFQDLINGCLEKDPAKRPTAEQVKNRLTRELAVWTESDTQSPFPGLLPYGEKTASLFFGREQEIGALVSALEHQAFITLVGPSGVGKSSIMHAGVIPRLKEAADWRHIALRPSRHPFTILAEELKQMLAQLHMELRQKTSRDNAAKSPPPIPRDLGEKPSIHRIIENLGEKPITEVLDPAELEELVEMERNSSLGSGSQQKQEFSGEISLTSFRSEQLSIPIIIKEFVETDVTIIREKLLAYPALLGELLTTICISLEKKVVITVDQFEELFTLEQDPVVKEVFLQALRNCADDPSSPVRVICTLRSDYLIELTKIPGGDQMISSVSLVEAPSKEALARILKYPLMKVQCRFEDEQMVEEMIEEVHHEQSALPLLQVALTSLWKERDLKNGVLRRKDFESMGRVTGLLAKKGDALLSTMTPDERRLAREICLKMTTPEGLRKPLGSWDIPPRDKHWLDILHRFVEAGLIVEGGENSPDLTGTVWEFAHEALINQWETLSSWVTNANDDLKVVEALSTAAKLWEARGKRESELWNERAVEEAVQALTNLNYSPPKCAQSFLRSSQYRVNRGHYIRRAITFGIMGTIVAIGVVGLVLAFAFKKKEAKARQDYLTAEKLRAQAEKRGEGLESQRQLAVQSREESRRHQSEALASGAYSSLVLGDYLSARAQMRGSLEVRDNLLARMVWNDLRYRQLLWWQNLSGHILGMRFHPGGKWLAVVAYPQTIHILDPLTKNELRALRGHSSPITGLATDARGEWLVSRSRDGRVMAWHEASSPGDLIVRGGKQQQGVVALSPDARHLAIEEEGRVKLYDFVKKKLLWQRKIGAGPVHALLFGPDGKSLYVGAPWLVMQLKADKGTPLKEITLQMDRIGALAFSSDSRFLFAGGSKGLVYKIASATLSLAGKLETGMEEVRSLSTSRQEDLLAAAGTAKHVVLFRGPSHKIFRYAKGDRPVRAAAIHPQHLQMAAGGDASRIWLWDVRHPLRRERLYYQNAPMSGIAFSRKGNEVYSVNDSGELLIWPTQSPRIRQRLKVSSRKLWNIDVSPVDDRIAVCGDGGYIGILDTQGREIKRLSDHEGEVHSVRFSPSGKQLLSVGSDGIVRLWNLTTGGLIKRLKQHQGVINEVVYAPSGRYYATASADGTIRIWSAQAHVVTQVLRSDNTILFGLAWESDSRTLLSGDYLGQLKRWTIATGKSETLLQVREAIFWIAARGNKVAVGTEKGVLHVGTRTGQKYQWRVAREQKGAIMATSISPVGVIASTSLGGTLQVRDGTSLGSLWSMSDVILDGEALKVVTPDGWRTPGAQSERLTSAAPPKLLKGLDPAELRTAHLSYSPAFTCIGKPDGTLTILGAGVEKRLSVPRLEGVLQVGRRCVVRRDAGLLAFGPRSVKGREIVSNVNGMTQFKGTLYTWRRDQLLEYKIKEKAFVHIRTWKLRGNPSSVYVNEEALFVGYQFGDVDIFDKKKQGSTSTNIKWLNMENSPVTAILPGPAKILVVGFENGVVGIWNSWNGNRVMARSLHGSVRSLHVADKALYAFSRLGDNLRWDLAPLYTTWCNLLKSVWKLTPIAFSSRRIVRKAIPKKHRCLK